MLIRIIAAGRASRKPIASITDDYLRRLPWPAEIIEVAVPAHKEQAALERKMIGGHEPGRSFLCLLDEGGKQLTSRQFADFFKARLENSIKEIRFIIGGADGVSDDMRQKADFVLALGSMTWPHLLVRAMLAEQIYRAATILQGHPYHRA